MIKSSLVLITLVAALSYLSLSASTTATATVAFSVGSTDSFLVSGDPPVLSISTAPAGSNPVPATNSSTSYSVTTNNAGRKITGVISVALPTGVTLSMLLAAPTGATSAGVVALTTSPQDLVTGIGNVSETGLMITYILSATAAATQSGSIDATTVTLTFGQ